MEYADKEYYSNTFGGSTIPEASFTQYARKATQEIRLITFDRVKENNIPDDVKMCCCELAECIYSKEQIEIETGTTSGIKSESVGEHSVSYESADIRQQMYKNKKAEILNNWLLFSGLLYRGLD